MLLIAFSLIFGSLAHGDGAPNTAASDEPRVTLSFSGADLLETLYRLFQGTGFHEAPETRPRHSSIWRMPLETALRVVLEPRALPARAASTGLPGARGIGASASN